MITIISEKPMRSIQVIGYGVDSYKDKEEHEIWRVYGIVSPAKRGRVVTRDGAETKDIYLDENLVVIFRSSKKEDAVSCKVSLDKTIANGFPLFSVDAFREWLKSDKKKVEEQKPAVEQKPSEVTANAN